jgi:hypothetical protein
MDCMLSGAYFNVPIQRQKQTQMKKHLLLSLITVSLFAGKPVQQSPWNAFTTSGQNSGPTVPISGDIATFSIPDVSDKIRLVAFLTTETIQGDFTGKTVTADLFMTSTGSPQFIYNSVGSGCPAPANVRLYFTTVTGTYDLRNANAHQTNYWWSTKGIQLPDLVTWPSGGVFMISLDPSLWSDSQGVLGSIEPEAFAAAVRNVKQIGLSFGGGCYYDIGVGLSNKAPNSANLHLVNFTIE